MVTVSDGKVRPQPMRLHLSMELLRLQKEELSPINHNYNRKPSPVDSRVSTFIIYRHHLIYATSQIKVLPCSVFLCVLQFILMKLLRVSVSRISNGMLLSSVLIFFTILSKGCHLDVVRGPSTPHDPESDAGGSLSSWQEHPSR
jgi:hypothetical protein